MKKLVLDSKPVQEIELHFVHPFKEIIIYEGVDDIYKLHKVAGDRYTFFSLNDSCVTTGIEGHWKKVLEQKLKSTPGKLFVCDSVEDYFREKWGV